MVAWVAMKTTDSALLGHAGSEYLEGAALSDLYTSSSRVFLNTRVLGIFAGNAIGAGQLKMVGVWFQVSLVLLALVAVPVIALWSVTEPVLLLLGVAPNLARIAGHYALILIASIPPMIISSQLAKMLEAQRIMYPSVVAALAAMACNVLFGLVFVLGVGIPGWSGFGFLACPTVTAAMEWLQLAVVYFVFIAWKGLHKPCWPGWAWRHVTRTRLVAYARLYGPASLSIASDFGALPLSAPLPPPLVPPRSPSSQPRTASCGSASPLSARSRPPLASASASPLAAAMPQTRDTFHSSACSLSAYSSSVSARVLRSSRASSAPSFPQTRSFSTSLSVSASRSPSPLPL
ncbi:uncharacterized protein AMSG_06136 [Thecamonas trahens ATCC 50062]|uniref:Uncharacterized protein n=1 Tax=Thecamonas trahens ATCC 50062 TaxID=461836 RepID=A0A0L0DBW9_THETB|nr:hypothetical protein AMSG_06136 [Thecamonas trahens ATCC 50062]KNC49849.1 hypothetical protein AMSG_06136 [Thecamonas trahens ATCC 50062]|eukprot:XP_013757337.1 hypothetical protein AMSG_06136 [Thecamonas trahens ATCC 50062]